MQFEDTIRVDHSEHRFIIIFLVIFFLAILFLVIIFSYLIVIFVDLLKR